MWQTEYYNPHYADICLPDMARCDSTLKKYRATERGKNRQKFTCSPCSLSCKSEAPDIADLRAQNVFCVSLIYRMTRPQPTGWKRINPKIGWENYTATIVAPMRDFKITANCCPVVRENRKRGLLKSAAVQNARKLFLQEGANNPI